MNEATKNNAPRRLALASSLLLGALPLALLWIAGHPAGPVRNLTTLVDGVAATLTPLLLAAGVNAVGFGLGLGGAITRGARRWRLTALTAAVLHVGGWVALLALSQ